MGETCQHVNAFIFNGQRDTRDQLAWDKSSYNSVTNGSQVAYWSTLWHVTADNLANPHMSGSDFFSHNTPGLIKTEDGGKTFTHIISNVPIYGLDVVET